MKPVLNSTQVAYILHRLSVEGINDHKLKDELVDHICCIVEEQMGLGIVFHQACDRAFMAFGENGMKEIQTQTFHSVNQKSQFMKNFSFLMIGLSLLLLPLLWLGPNVFSEGSAEKDQILKELSQTPLSNLLTTISVPLSCPLKENYPVSSAFGMRMHPLYKVKKMHRGIDFKAPKGTPVYAPSDGVVVKATNDPDKFGKHILIKHDQVYQSFYAHLSELEVNPGEKVKKGLLLGRVGTTGMSTAPHLHYEIIKDGQPVDPMDYCKP